MADVSGFSLREREKITSDHSQKSTSSSPRVDMRKRGNHEEERPKSGGSDNNASGREIPQGSDRGSHPPHDAFPHHTDGATSPTRVRGEDTLERSSPLQTDIHQRRSNSAPAHPTGQRPGFLSFAAPPGGTLGYEQTSNQSICCDLFVIFLACLLNML